MGFPQSKIYICRDIHLTNDYKHTIYFDSPDSQKEYFSERVVNTLSDYTYLRKNWSIKVDAPLNTANTWSYLYFENKSDFPSKTYYYFITDVQYISDTVSELHLEMDVMQTYMFDYQLNPCFVEREHSETDGIGEHLEEENLDIGFYVNKTVNEETDLDELCILVLSTVDILSATLVGEGDNQKEVYDNYYGGKIDGVFSGAGLWAAKLSSWGSVVSILRSMDKAGVSDGVIAMYMYPKNLVKLSTGYTWDDSHGVKPVYGIDKEKTTQIFSSPTTMADGKPPKNKKLLSYPFSYLYVTNNQGSGAIYKYERFDLNDAGYRFAQFKYGGTVLPDGGVNLMPMNYENMEENFENSLFLSNFPMCSWNQDVYKLWLAQNQNTQNLTVADGVVKIGVGLITTATSIASGNMLGSGAGIGTAYSGASQIANLMAQRKDMEIQPQQSKGAVSGSINTAIGKKHYTIMEKCIDSASSKRIDEYFTMYGYKTNRVKIPNTNVRTNFTYTKTIGCSIKYANFPIADQRKIESIFDNGITFWKNGDFIGHYSLSNEPI